ncbi:hypothetical protein [Staphylococcus phage vB_SsapH-Golestan-100]|nr:hypothetical protein [Staphylococcus phage vB_SsapH-Golestan-100]
MRAAQIRDRMQQKKASLEDTKKETISNFNNTAQTLTKAFFQKVQNGEVEITDVNEFQRIFAMFLQINELENGTDGNGVLPQLSVSQNRALDQNIEFESDDEGEQYVVESSIEDMTEEDLMKMIAQKEEAMNEDNYRQF